MTRDWGEATVLIEDGHLVVRDAPPRIGMSRELYEMVGADGARLPFADFGPEGTFLLAGDPNHAYVKVEDRGEIIVCKEVMP